MQHTISHCGVVVVAAGQSKRLGQPKQLLIYEGKTLIDRLIDTIQLSGDFATLVVLGAEAQMIQQQITNTHVQVVVNERWEEGMSGSIKLGLTTLLQNNPAMDGVMILVCDQPFITPANIQSLIQLQKETQKPIAACFYAKVLGTPALFHQSFFAQLLTLTGDAGAKKIIQQYQQEVTALHFEKGLLDIDTLDDYLQLINAPSI